MDKYLKSLEILGLDKTATIGEIKLSYRELVQILHPDKCSNEKLKTRATREFKKIDEAYNYILKNYGKVDLEESDDFDNFEEDIENNDDNVEVVNFADNDISNDDIPQELPKLRPITIENKFMIILGVCLVYTLLFFCIFH